MKHLNKQRILIKVIKELSEELEFDAQFLSENWIICLKKGGQTHYIYGYEWDLNSAATQLIAKDKTATYEILAHHQIDAIEHKLFFNYNLQVKYTGQNGCWKDILDYVQKHKNGADYQVICKPNKGTGGNDVYKISNQIELESVVQKMFSKYRDLCLCPFYNIDSEYRAIFLNNEIVLLYLKDRPFVVGNGKDNLATLIINKYKENGIGYLENLDSDLNMVLPQSEKKIISWKHNLGNGATAVIVEDTKIKDDISKLVLKVADILNIKFASIDIVSIHGKYYVMEVNSGIMIENFAMQPKDEYYDYYNITKNIYRKALEYLFQYSNEHDCL